MLTNLTRNECLGVENIVVVTKIAATRTKTPTLTRVTARGGGRDPVQGEAAPRELVKDEIVRGGGAHGRHEMGTRWRESIGAVPKGGNAHAIVPHSHRQVVLCIAIVGT